MNNLKVGIRLGIGFAVVLLLMVLLGGLAIKEQRTQRDTAARIANAYIPEMSVAVAFERSTREVILSVTQYISSSEEHYYTAAANKLKEMDIVAGNAEDLLAKYPYLHQLADNLNAVKPLFEKYKKMIETTRTYVQSLNQKRASLEKLGSEFFDVMDTMVRFGQEQTEILVLANASAHETVTRIANVNILTAILADGNAIQAGVFRAQMYGDIGILKKTLEIFPHMLQKLAEAEKNALEQNKERVAKVTALALDYKQHTLELIEEWEQLRKLSEERVPLGDAVLNNALSTATASTNNVESLCDAAGKVADSSITLLMWGLGLGAALGLFIAWLLTHSVTEPLKRSTDFAIAVDNGQLDDTLNIYQKDEIGQLANALNSMVKTLAARIREASLATAEANNRKEEATEAMQVAERARAQAETAKRQGMLDAALQLESIVSSLSSASEELSTQVEQASRGAQEQAQRVGIAASSMEEMSLSVVEVAKNASATADVSVQARQKASIGADMVQQVVAGMDRINGGAVELRSNMEELSHKAESIGSILNVISDIADQTNLLALNAAIEAARAGEAGRGFAVVADEVRKLAEKTMQATSQVDEAIKGIQYGTSMNMTKVEGTVKVVNEVTDLATQSGQALSEIVELVDRAAEQVRTIAAASEQQSGTSQSINGSVEDINRIATETAQTMYESGNAVNDLSRQAQVLNQLISDMKRG